MAVGQRVNHFLNSLELTRKDRIFHNFMRMRKKFGPEEFDYLPETYVLPEQSIEFKNIFNQNAQKIKRREARGDAQDYTSDFPEDSE